MKVQIATLTRYNIKKAHRNTFALATSKEYIVEYNLKPEGIERYNTLELNEKNNEVKPRMNTATIEMNKPSRSSLANSLKDNLAPKLTRGQSTIQRKNPTPGHKQFHFEVRVKPL